MALRFEAKIDPTPTQTIAPTQTITSTQTLTPTQTIDLICELAKAKNKNGLSKLISSGVCIGIYDGKASAICRIAAENKVDLEALEFLIKEFGASINDAVEGAARGGHVPLVEDLIRRGASLNYAVGGAAIRGDVLFVEDLINRGAKLDAAVTGEENGLHGLIENLFRRNVNLDRAILGAAKGGHVSLVEDLLRRPGASDDSLNCAIYGAAIGSHESLLKDLISRPGAILDFALTGAAHAGNAPLMEDLLRRPRHFMLETRLHSAVFGAAIGGHVSLLYGLLDRESDEAHWDNAVKNRRLLDRALDGAGCGGHMSLVEDLRSRRYGASLCAAVKGAVNGGHLANETLALRFLTSIKEPRRRRGLAENAIQDKLIKSFDMLDLVPKADALADLIKAKNIGFDQALAWQNEEVQGLLAFAQCVQLEKFLPVSLSCLTATFLSPFLINGKEARDLFEKMPLELRKIDLSINLQNYHLSSSRYFFLRDRRATKFKQICQQAQSEKELDQCIKDEISSATKQNKDPYSELLKSYASKF